MLQPRRGDRAGTHHACRLASAGHCLIVLLLPLALAGMSVPSCQANPEKDRTVYAQMQTPVGEAASTTQRAIPTQPVVAPAPASAPASEPSTAPTSQGAVRKTAPQEIVAASILQVNDRFITLQQVFHPIRKQLQAAAAVSEAEEEFRNKASDMIDRELRDQVEQEVLFAEAQRRLSEEEKKLVQEQIDDRARRVIAQAGSKSRFEEQLKKEFTDYSTWVEDMNRSVMVDAFIHQQFRSKVNIDRMTMLKYYNEHLDKFRQGQQIQMQVISSPFASFMSATQPDSIEARRKAVGAAHRLIVQAQEALAKGEDFAEVAKKFDRGPMASKGGVWPPMERGSFKASEVEEAALKQPVGKVSGIVDSIHGFYIVKTLSSTGGDNPSFDKVQKQIEAELRRDQYKKMTADYLKELQKQTFVRGTQEAEKLAVDAAVKQFWNK